MSVKNDSIRNKIYRRIIFRKKSEAVRRRLFPNVHCFVNQCACNCIRPCILYKMRMRIIDIRNRKRRDVVEAIVRQEPIHEEARIFKVPQRTVFDWLAWFWGGTLGRVEREEALGSAPKAERDADPVGL